MPEQKPNPEQEVAVKLSDLRIGGLDPRGRKVIDILWSVSEFKIFKTEQGISPFFSDDPVEGRKQKEYYLALGEDIAEFNHLIKIRPKGWFFGFSLKRNAGERADVLHERELARCIAIALFGNVDEARRALSAVRHRLEAQISDRARVTHLAMNLVLALVVWMIGYQVALSLSSAIFGFDIKHLSLAVMMGALGALFSTAVRLKSMEVDPSASAIMHVTYGGLRVLIGALGATFLYFGLNSGLLEATLRPGTPGPGTDASTINMHWLAFVSVLAGFSERLVPNLLEGKAESALSPKPGESGADVEASAAKAAAETAANAAATAEAEAKAAAEDAASAAADAKTKAAEAKAAQEQAQQATAEATAAPGDEDKGSKARGAVEAAERAKAEAEKASAEAGAKTKAAEAAKAVAEAARKKAEEAASRAR